MTHSQRYYALYYGLNKFFDWASHFLLLVVPAPRQPVSNITVESLSPTSLRLRWLPANPDAWNGIISRYTIEYSLLGQVREEGDDGDDEEGSIPSELLRMNFVTFAPSNRQRLSNNPDPRVAAVAPPLLWEELEISGLEEYFVYSFTIFYENSAGRSDSSNSVQLNLPPAGNATCKKLSP